MNDLSTALRILRRRLPVLVICILVAGAAALGYGETQHKLYTATSILWFENPGFDQALFGSTSILPSSQDPTSAENDNVALASLSVVSTMASETLGGARSAQQIRRELTAVGIPQSDIVHLVVTDRNPVMAARIANVAAARFVAFRRSADQSTIQSAIETIQGDLHAASGSPHSSTAGTDLQTLYNQLRVLKSLQTGNVEFVQQARVPTNPSSPRIKRDTALGLFLGLLLGLAIVALAERLDDQLKDRLDVERLSDQPILVEVPQQQVRRPEEVGGIFDRAHLEAFGLLRASLRYLNVERRLHVLVVTSASPSEGKSTVASGLAVAAASVGTRTLLIEADLRKPSLAGLFGVPAGAGISEVLTGQADFHDAVRTIDVSGDGDDISTRIDVMFSGAVPPNPAMLSESQMLVDLLDRAKTEYELVVVDTPPVGLVSDAIPMLQVADGVLVVCSLGVSRRAAVSHLFERLDQVHAPILGVVLNRALKSRHSYYYSYKTDKVAQPSDSPGPAPLA